MFHENSLKELFLLINLAVITALTVNFYSPAGIALIGEWDKSQGVPTAKPKNDNVDRKLEIGLLKAKEIYHKGKSVFIDARSFEMFEQGHIKNAVSVPVYQFDDLTVEFMENYPVSVPIVTYCTGRDCDDSHKLAKYLSELGYSNIKVYIDGYSAWKQGGNPIEE